MPPWSQVLISTITSLINAFISAIVTPFLDSIADIIGLGGA